MPLLSGIWHTHTTILQPFFWDHPDELVSEEIFFWTFMVQGKITEADTPTIWLGGTPSGLISSPPPLFPPFLCQIPFLLQSSHFILPWDRHQICWLPYPSAWFPSRICQWMRNDEAIPLFGSLLLWVHFSALTILAGWQEGHLASPTYPQVFSSVRNGGGKPTDS